MKTQTLTLLCAFTIFCTVAVANDAIQSQLKAMEADRITFAKLKGSSKEYYSENCPKYLTFLQQSAEQGYAIAQSFLGVCYSHGKGIPKDKALAVEWYRKAAEQGYAPAQANLGVMYRDGKGIAKDEAQAVAWLSKAAEQGYAPAQINLGSIYANSKGIAKNEAQAVTWFSKAAQQGYIPAQANLAAMYRDGKGVVKNKIQAEAWFLKADEPNEQSEMLSQFREICTEYDAQPNKILQSEISKKGLDIIEKANKNGINNWIGTLTQIKVNHNNSLMTLSITIDSSTIIDLDIASETPIYNAASDMHENDKVVFSGIQLTDYNFTERQKACAPDFEITITKLSKYAIPEPLKQTPAQASTKLESTPPAVTTPLIENKENRQESANLQARAALIDYAKTKGRTVEQLVGQTDLSYEELITQSGAKIYATPNDDQFAMIQSFEKLISAANDMTQDSVPNAPKDSSASQVSTITEKPMNATSTETAETVNSQSCLDIARTSMIGDTQEIVCSFTGRIKEKLMNIYTANGCENLVTKNELDKVDTEILKIIKNKYRKMGEKAYCNDAKGYYNGVVQALSLLAAKSNI